MTVLTTYRVAYRVAWSNVACQAAHRAWLWVWAAHYPARTARRFTGPHPSGGDRR